MLIDALALRLTNDLRGNWGLAFASIICRVNALNFLGGESSIVDGYFINGSGISVPGGYPGGAPAKVNVTASIGNQGTEICLYNAASIDEQGSGSAQTIKCESHMLESSGAEESRSAVELVRNTQGVDEI